MEIGPVITLPGWVKGLKEVALCQNHVKNSLFRDSQSSSSVLGPLELEKELQQSTDVV